MSQPAPWTRLYNNIKIAAPAATDPVIKQELMRVLVDFTQDTNLWCEDVTVTFLPNTYDYTFSVTDGTPNRLMLVYDAADPTRRWKNNGFSMPTPGIIHCVYPPSTSSAWKVRVAKAVTDPVTAENFPVLASWIVEKYSDDLYYGVLAYLQGQPKKSYSDPQSARGNLANYMSGKSRARIEGIRQNTYGSQAWTFPQGWAATSRKGWA
jgi:hypothetical protein